MSYSFPWRQREKGKPSREKEASHRRQRRNDCRQYTPQFEILEERQVLTTTIIPDTLWTVNPTPPTNNYEEMLKGKADDFINGANELLGSLSDSLREAIEEINDLPLIGDQLSEGLKPLFDQLQVAQGLVQEKITEVYAQSDGSYLGLLQQSFYEIFGTPGLQILRDGLDAGDDVNASDLGVKFGADKDADGNVIAGTDWMQFEFHLGSQFVVDLPFELGVGIGDLKLEDIFPGLGFSADGEVRLDFRWDFQIGIGVTERSDETDFGKIGGVYIVADAFDAVTGLKTPEFTASLNVSAAPPKDDFGNDLFDDFQSGLNTEVTLGLLQGSMSDGIAFEMTITSANPLELDQLSYGADFFLEVAYKDDPLDAEEEAEVHNVHIVVEEAARSFVDFLALLNLEVNAEVQEAFDGKLLAPLSVVPDFTDLQKFDFSRLGPNIKFVARNTHIVNLTIRDADELGFEMGGPEADAQYSDQNSWAVGFGGQESALDGQDQVIVADNPAPANGKVKGEDIDFYIVIGEGSDAKRVRVYIPKTRLALAREIESLDDLEVLVRDKIKAQVLAAIGDGGEPAFGRFDPDKIDVFVNDDLKFVIVVHPGFDRENLAVAPKIEIVTEAKDQTKLSLVFSVDITDPNAAILDITDPNYQSSVLKKEYDPDDQATYSRIYYTDLNKKGLQLSGKTKSDYFKVELKADAKIRLHVITGSDHVSEYLEEEIGLSEGALGLPSIEFDFKIDASASLSYDLAQKKKVVSKDIGDLTFRNVSLDIGEFLENVAVPVANYAGKLLGPLVTIFGEGANGAVSLLDEPLPLLKDINSDLDTIRELGQYNPLIGSIATLLDAISSIAQFATGVTDFLEHYEGQKIDFGSFVYDRQIGKLIPAEWSDAKSSAEKITLADFFQKAEFYRPGGVKIDLLKPSSIADMLMGKPFDMVSINLPSLNRTLTADLGVSLFDDYLGFNVGLGLSIDMIPIGIVYDSYGLEKMVNSIRSGNTPDFSDILDGLYIRNTAGPEIAIELSAYGSGSVDIAVASAWASASLRTFAYLDIYDPNEDGKLRLDEIMDVTDDFSSLEKLFWMFDVESGMSLEVGGGGSIGIDPLSASVSWDFDVAGSLSLAQILESLFGLDPRPAKESILATEINSNDTKTLQINAGLYAADRVYGDNSDIADTPLRVAALDNGNVELVPLNGAKRTFVLQADGSYRSPTGDESTLKKNADGTWTRELNDFYQTVQTFDTLGYITKSVDDFERTTTYTYNAQHQLTKIVTPKQTINYYPGGANVTVWTDEDGYIHVQGYGIEDQKYGLASSYSSIIAVGGDGDDTFDFSGVSGVMVNARGGAGNDTIKGGSGNDLIYGEAGNDTLEGGAGNDYLSGGTGSNTVADGTGNDFVDLRLNAVGINMTTGGGDDTVLGSEFDDIITAKVNDTGNVLFRGYRGNDTLAGAAGNDLLYGGEGDDTLSGNAGDDLLLGEWGDDAILGGTGSDSLEGGDGNDVLTAGYTDAWVDGGIGNDQLIFDDSDGLGLTILFTSDSIMASEGTDEESYTQLLRIESVSALFGSGTDDVTVEDPTVPFEVDGGGNPANAGDKFTVRLTAASDLNGTLTDSAIEGLGLAAPLSYANFEFLDLQLGSGNDTLTITSTGDETETSIRMGAGDDRIEIVDVSPDSDTLLIGEGGDDQVTVFYTEAPTDLQNLKFTTIEKVTVDNTIHTDGVAWEYVQGILKADGDNVLDLTGAGLLLLRGGSGTDSLTMTDNVNVTQTALVDGDSIEILEGEDVLSFGGSTTLSNVSVGVTVDGLDGVRALAEYDDDARGINNFYAVADGDDAISVYRRDATGRLYFIHVLKDGVAGVDGLDGADSVAVSSDGKYVYVGSTVDNAVAIFARDQYTGRLTYVGKVDAGAAVIDIAADPNVAGRLFVATASSIKVYARNESTGLLTLADTKTTAGTIRAITVIPNGSRLYFGGQDVSGAHDFASYEISASGLSSSVTTESGSNSDFVNVFDIAADSTQVYLAGEAGMTTFTHQYVYKGFVGTDNYDIANGTSVPVYKYANATSVAASGSGEVQVGFDRNTGPAMNPVYTITLDRIDIYNSDDGWGDDTLELHLATQGLGAYSWSTGTGSIAINKSFSYNNSFYVVLDLWEEDTFENDEWEAKAYSSNDYGPGSYSLNFQNCAVVYFTITKTIPSKVVPDILTVSTDLGTTSSKSYNPSGFDRVDDLRFSLDGNSFYAAASNSDLIAIYSGQQLDNGAAFVTQVRDGDAQTVSGAGQNAVVAISPDGKQAYVTSNAMGIGTISVYNRDSSTGALSANAIQELAIDGLIDPASLTFNSAGNSLLVASSTTGSLYRYTRNLTDGKLTLAQSFQDGAGGVDLAGASDVIDVGDHIYVTSSIDDAVSIFSRNSGTGVLTYAGKMTTGLDGPSSLVASSDGKFLYVASELNSSVVVFSRNATTGALTSVETFTPASVVGIGRPVDLVMSPDANQQFLYVAGGTNDAISVFQRDAATGKLTLVQSVFQGVGGVSGMEGLSAITVSADGKYLFAAGSTRDSLTVFARNTQTGELIYKQRISNGAAGVSGVVAPTSLAVYGNQLYVGSAGRGATSGGVAMLNIATSTPPATSYRVDYDQVESLTVNTAAGNDLVSVRDVAVDVTVNTGGGADLVTIQKAAAGKTTTVNTGAGNDDINLRATGTEAITVVDAGDGDDRIAAITTGDGTTTLKGGAGKDRFFVDGTSLGATLTVVGGDPTTNPGDELILDTKGLGADPDVPVVPAGSVRVEGEDYGVDYSAIEKITLIAAPLANAGSPLAINEGQSISLNASATIPNSNGIATYAWDLNGDGIFGDAVGVQPIVTWAQLKALGVGDNGTYVIAVRATNDVGSGEATTTLTIANTAPAVTLAGPTSVEQYYKYTLSFSSTDPGDDKVTSYLVDWGDGTAVQRFLGSAGSLAHFYQTNGDFTIQVTPTDEDGMHGATSKSITVTEGVTPTRVLSGASSVEEGSSYQLSLSTEGAGSTEIVGWKINWGDGTTSELAVSNSDDELHTLLTQHTYADNGSYRIVARYTLNNGDTHEADNSMLLGVTNVRPAITVAASATQLLEGESVLLQFSATDPGNDRIDHWIINWGDGRVETFYGNPGSASHLYRDDGLFQVVVAAVDEDGTHLALSSPQLDVANVNPNLHVAGASSVNEGTKYTLSLSASDIGNDRISSWTVNWGDGKTETVRGRTPTLSHYYLDGENQYSILVTAEDEDGTYAADPLTVTVLDVAPLPAVAGDESVDEGAEYTLELHSQDPGADVVNSWEVDWGDGEIETILPVSTQDVRVTLSGSRVILANADGTISVYDFGESLRGAVGTLADGEVMVSAATLRDLIAGTAGESLPVTGSTTAMDGVAERMVTSLDLSKLNAPPGTTAYRINWNDGSPVEEFTTAAVVSHTFLGEVEYQTLFVGFVDEAGEITAVDVPFLTGESVYRDELELLPSHLDSYRIDWGDGTFDEYSNADADEGKITIVHRFGGDQKAGYAVRVSQVLHSAVRTEIEDLAVDVDVETTGNLNYTLSLPKLTGPNQRYIVEWDDLSQSVFTNADIRLATGTIEATHLFLLQPTEVTRHVTVSVEQIVEEILPVESASAVVVAGTPQLTAQIQTSFDFAEAELGEGGFVVFDYQSETDFKFAGVRNLGGQREWVIGHVDESGWIIDSSSLQAITVKATHVYADNRVDEEPYVVVATAIQGTERYQAAEHLVTVLDVAPTIELSGTPQKQLDHAFHLELGAVSDPAGSHDTVTEYRVYWGDGSTFDNDSNMATPDDAFQLFTTRGTVSHHFVDGELQHSIVVQLVDEDGLHVAAGSLNVAAESTSEQFELNGLNDHGSSYIVEWGDGTQSVYSISDMLVDESGHSAIQAEHFYHDNGLYTIRTYLRDQYGNITYRPDREVVISNVAPEIGGVATDQHVNEGNVLTLHDILTFEDVGSRNDAGGTDETFTYIIDWGDGTSDSGVATVDGVGDIGLPTLGSFDGSHAYADYQSKTPYTVTVTVIDDDGGMATASFAVTVYRPDIRIDSILTDTSTNELVVQYTVTDTAPGTIEGDVDNSENAAVHPFHIGVVSSLVPTVTGDSVDIDSLAIDDMLDRSAGTHVKRYAIGTEVVLPGAGFGEFDTDYYLLGVMDRESQLQELDETNNVDALIGIYRGSDNRIYVQGTEGADDIRIVDDGGNLRVEMVGQFVGLYGGSDQVRLRSHGGDDEVSVLTSVSDLVSFGGDGNDRLHLKLVDASLVVTPNQSGLPGDHQVQRDDAISWAAGYSGFEDLVIGNADRVTLVTDAGSEVVEVHSSALVAGGTLAADQPAQRIEAMSGTSFPAVSYYDLGSLVIDAATRDSDQQIVFGDSMDLRDLTVKLGMGTDLVRFENEVHLAGGLLVEGDGATALSFLDEVTASALTVLGGGTTTIHGGLVSTSGEQHYSGDLVLAEDAILLGSDVRVTGAIDGEQSLRVEGNLNALGDIGQSSALASLVVTGETVFAGQAIRTTSDQEYLGRVLLDAADGSTVIIEGDTITFDSTVDGDVSLTVLAATQWNDAIGSSEHLRSLELTGPALMNGKLVETDRNQLYRGPVTLADDLTLTSAAGDIAFIGSVDGIHELAAEANEGTIRFEGEIGRDGAIEKLSNTAKEVLFGQAVHLGEGGLEVLGAGEATISGGLIETEGTQLFTGEVQLGADAMLHASTVTFEGTVDGEQELRIEGNLRAEADIGGDAALLALSITGDSRFAGRLLATQDTLQFQGSLQLAATEGSDVWLAGSTVEFNSTVDGVVELTVSGAARWQGDVGGNERLLSLTAAGSSVLDGVSIETVANQQFQGGVSVSSDTLLRSLEGDVVFQAAVDGKGPLSIEAAQGAVDFDAAVGADTSLDQLDLTAGSIRFGSSLDFGSGGAKMNSDTVIMEGVIRSREGGSWTIQNAGLFQLAAGADVELDGELSQEGEGAVLLEANILTHGQNISFAGKQITIKGNRVLATEPGIAAKSLALNQTGGHVTVEHGIEGTRAGSDSLSIKAAGSNVAVHGDIGATVALAGVSISARHIALNNVTTQAGDQSYSGDLLLNTNGTATETTLATSGGSLLVKGHLDSAAHVLLNAGPGNITVTNETGSQTRLASLTAQGSRITLNGVTTKGAQKYTPTNVLVTAGTFQTERSDISINGRMQAVGTTTILTTGGTASFQRVDLTNTRVAVDVGAGSFNINDTWTGTGGSANFLGEEANLRAVMLLGSHIGLRGADRNLTGSVALVNLIDGKGSMLNALDISAAPPKGRITGAPPQASVDRPQSQGTTAPSPVSLILDSRSDTLDASRLIAIADKQAIDPASLFARPSSNSSLWETTHRAVMMTFESRLTPGIAEEVTQEIVKSVSENDGKLSHAELRDQIAEQVSKKYGVDSESVKSIVQMVIERIHGKESALLEKKESLPAELPSELPKSLPTPREEIPISDKVLDSLFRQADTASLPLEWGWGEAEVATSVSAETIAELLDESPTTGENSRSVVASGSGTVLVVGMTQLHANGRAGRRRTRAKTR